jgi:hypothetical protein
MEKEPIGDRKRGEAGHGGSPIKKPEAIATRSRARRVADQEARGDRKRGEAGSTPDP